MAQFKPQRIRDPLHNLIEFKANEFENMIWELIQTEPFQRLRRIKQLGFSEHVYPGATHTRFAHSVGVFHTARRLMEVAEKHLKKENRLVETKVKTALAAALLHDVGHGPFSHAFEDVAKKLNFKNVNHELIGKRLIKRDEISSVLKEGGVDADKVAQILTGGKDIYGAVVSSQFDADRLDYMRRDRLMTGSCHGRIDFEWLLANLEVGEFRIGVDKDETGRQETFILSDKAVAAAESYILGLFQFYPTIYYHKTTRGMEKIFSELLMRVIKLVIEEKWTETGLTEKHPIVKFAEEPEKLDNILSLDDTVILGSLSLLKEAKDPLIKEFSGRLWSRNLYKVIDINQRVEQELVRIGKNKNTLENRSMCQRKIQERLQSEKEKDVGEIPQILIDQGSRSPYKKASDSNSPLNQIRIKTAGGETVDLEDRSAFVGTLESFDFYRVYVPKLTSSEAETINRIIEEEVTKL